MVCRTKNESRKEYQIIGFSKVRVIASKDFIFILPQVQQILVLLVKAR